MKTSTKKSRGYRITIENMDTENPRSMQLDVEDREDIFAIVEKLKQGSGLDEKSATQMGIGLRLLGPLMMQNRKHPLFTDFMPHFKTFMLNLKKKVKGSVEQ